MTPRDKLTELERTLEQAIARDVGVRSAAAVDEARVRERMAAIAHSLGNAWDLQFGFNPYEAKHLPGQHDQSSHGGGGGTAVATPSAPGVPMTLKPTWQSTRAPLDTSRLTGANSNAIDPPNLTTALAEERLLGLYERAVAQGHAAKDANWYVDRHNLAGKWADEIGVDRQRFIDAVAATSPLTAWDLANSPRLPNLEAARAMVLAERAHPDLSSAQIRDMVPRSQGYPFLGNSAQNAVRALRGEDPNEVFKANKIRSFNNDMSHPEHPTNVTIDTHMGRMMLNRHDDTDEAKKEVESLIQGRKLGRGPTAQTLGGYGWAADRVRSVAATKQMVPSSFQAIVWEQWRREGGAVTMSRAAKMTKSEDDLTEAEVWELWQDVIAWAEAGAPADWKPDQKLRDSRGRWVKATEEKYNPYHEEGSGRFTSSDEAGFVSLAGKPTERGEVVGRGKDMLADVSPERMAAKRQAMITEHSSRAEALAGRQLEAQMTFDAKTEIDRKLAIESQHLGREEERLKDEVGHIKRDIEHIVPQDPESQAAAREFLAGVQARYDAVVIEHNEAYARMEANEANLKAATQEYADKIDKITAERMGLNQELREKYVNAPEGPANIAIRQRLAADGSTEPTPGHWTTGVQALNEIVGKGAVAAGRREGDVPQVRITRMEETDAWYASGRSYHSSVGSGAIAMHPNDERVSTVVHEMGHWVEDKIPGMPARIEEHIQSRTQGESTQSLNSLTGSNFNANEVSKPDHFADPYMGKDYGGGAHEFLSMSVQLMYDNPVKFAKDDPQSFDFTMQVLAEARQNGGTLEIDA